MTQIRKAVGAEAQSILDLHSDTVRRVNSRDYSNDQIEAWLGQREADVTLSMIEAGEYYVAVDDEGRLIGVRHMKDRTISGLYVSADRQGQGVGTALLMQMERDAIADGAGVMQIDSPLTATKFYESRGYCAVDRRRIGKAQLDVIVMRKCLRPKI